MTSTDALSAANRARAARLLLACLSADGAGEASAVLDECQAIEGALGGLVSVLASGLLEMLIDAAGLDGARKTLSMSLLDAEADGE